MTREWERDAVITSTVQWPTPPRMPRVKALLRTGEEICSLSAFYGDTLANARNDVSTLILRDKWPIEKWWTAHGRAAHCHYRLRLAPHQLSLAEAGR